MTLIISFLFVCIIRRRKKERTGEDEEAINGKRRNKESCRQEKEITQEVISRTFTRLGLKIEAPRSATGFPVASSPSCDTFGVFSMHAHARNGRLRIITFLL